MTRVKVDLLTGKPRPVCTWSKDYTYKGKVMGLPYLHDFLADSSVLPPEEGAYVKRTVVKNL